MQTVRVHFLPLLVAPKELSESTCVVIDVLRATTTIAQALASGARQIVPCLEVSDALRAAAGIEGALLGGERGGLRIEGFQLGNSPGEYTPEAVSGKTIVFTTTNGTRAMLHCRQAKEVLLAAFVNLEAVNSLLDSCPTIDILCACTGGRITREDVLLAGALADELAEAKADLNDQAEIARDAWRQVAGSERSRENLSIKVAAALRRTQGGRNLTRLGLERDIDLSSQVNSLNIVPRYEPAKGIIRIGSS